MANDTTYSLYSAETHEILASHPSDDIVFASLAGGDDGIIRVMYDDHRDAYILADVSRGGGVRAYVKAD